MKRVAKTYPITPDGRYFVVGGRLWRMSDPALSDIVRNEAVSRLMTARRAVKTALSRHDRVAERAARSRVDEAKIALGERGPVWWPDDQPDLTRRHVVSTEYAGWYEQLA